MSETNPDPRDTGTDDHQTTGSGAAASDVSLPALATVRPHAAGDETVVVTFENGAGLRYRERNDRVVEVWESPDGERLTRERDVDGGAESAALRAVAAYLSFESRERAAFVWGEENVATLLGEEP